MKTIHAGAPLLDIRCELSESPVYERETDTLHFLDIARCEVHHYHLPTKEHTVDYYAEEISCIRLRDGQPGFVAAAPQGFAFLPFRSPHSSPTTRTPVPYHTHASTPSATTEMMFNDGEVDPQGRFVAGTKIKRGLPIQREAREAVLLRFEGGEGEKAEVVLEGLGLPNGIGFTSDGKTAYITDSLQSCIYRYFYSPSGKLTNQHLFIDTKTEPTQGIPDGLVLDAQDNLYSAKFRGSRVTRYTPSGIADLEILFPEAYNITAVELGGHQGSTLFVTTAAVSESGEGGKRELVERCWRSGAVWAIELDGEGVRARGRGRFRGGPRAAVEGEGETGGARL